jgi:nucleotide-binding universal stress UspA family protein
MYKTILVPLDGSKRAEAIFPHVEELARSIAARVIFIQVIEPAPSAIGHEVDYLDQYQKMMDKLGEESEKYLKGLQEKFLEKQIGTDICVAHGPVVKQIIEIADRKDADLIAIASHGRTGLSRVFYGSVAAGVLHQIDRPLLIIRSV